MKRLVLFDIDGTILLSGGAGRRAILRAIDEEAGIEAAAVETVQFGGKTDPEIVRELCEVAGRGDRCDESLIGRVIARYLFHLEDELGRNGHLVTLMPGIPALLATLAADHRIVLGLLTGNVSHGASLKLTAAGIDPSQFRVAAYGSDHHVRSALPPIAVRRAVAVFGRELPGSDVVIIGDTPADMTCGQGIGARAIGVATGGFTAAQLVAAGGHSVFGDLSDTAVVHRAIVGQLD